MDESTGQPKAVAPAGGPISGRVRTATVTVLAIVTALVVGAFFIIATNSEALSEWGRFFSDPAGAVMGSASLVARSYWAMLVGGVGSRSALSETLTQATPLILAGLAVAFAFRGGLFNIGASGQILMGSIFAAYVGFAFELPAPVHVAAALLAGFVGGALWSGVAGTLKAFAGAHEVITTIMLNFVALGLLDWLLTTSVFLPPHPVNPVSREVHATARLPRFSDSLRVNAGILIAITAVIVLWWVIERTTFGFQVRTLGHNLSAARYSGMRIGVLIVATMMVAGGLAGLSGASVVLGVTPRLTGGLSATGYDAIAVAILGRSRPVGVLAAALLFGCMRAGALNMQAQTAVRSDIVAVIQALIVIFVAAPELIRRIYRVRTIDVDTQIFSTNWGG